MYSLFPSFPVTYLLTYLLFFLPSHFLFSFFLIPFPISLRFPFQQRPHIQPGGLGGVVSYPIGVEADPRSQTHSAVFRAK